jgi:hypothetical protein
LIKTGKGRVSNNFFFFFFKKKKRKGKDKEKKKKKIKNSTENVAPLDFARSAIRDMDRVVV